MSRQEIDPPSNRPDDPRSPAGDGSGAEPGARLRRVLAALVLTILAVAFVVSLERSLRKVGDFGSYIEMARSVVEGFDPYGLDENHRWPPSMAIIYSPLAFIDAVSEPATRFLYLLFSWWCLFDTLRIAVRRLTGKRLAVLGGQDRVSIGEPAIALAILASLRFLLSTARANQPTLILLWMAVKALDLIERDKDGRAAFLTGTAISIKLTPLVWVGYFAFRGHLRAVALSLVCVGVWFATPFAVLGPERAISTYQTWLGMNPSSQSLRAPVQVRDSNESVYAMFDRWLGYGPLTLPDSEKSPLSTGESAPLVATGIFLAGLGGLYLFCAGRPFRRAPRSDGAAGRARRITEEGLIGVFALYAAPLSWRHYYVIEIYLLLGLFTLIAAEIDSRRRRLAIGLCSAAFFLQTKIWKLFVPEAAEEIVAWQSLTLLGSLLYVGLGLWYLRSTPPDP